MLELSYCMGHDEQLYAWVRQQFPSNAQGLSIALIAGDASPRRYYRVKADTSDGEVDSDVKTGADNGVNSVVNLSSDSIASWIAVVSPPSEKFAEFIHVHGLLATAGLRVPALLAANLERGFMLLEDLGDTQLLAVLTDSTVASLYAQSLAMLLNTAGIPIEQAQLPAYDVSLLKQELDLFPEWFMAQLLSAPLLEESRKVFDTFSDYLIASATGQPQVVVHRDFHSRNLMLLENNAIATIDFQDAVIGPVTYDPASLLKDCYVAWPRAMQLRLLDQHRAGLEACGVMPATDSEQFVRWFDLMGLQRHIKCLGIFARLSIRDDKHAYLGDLPLVLAYVGGTLSLYKDGDVAISDFAHWFDAVVMPLCEQQSWYRPVVLEPSMVAR